MITILPTFYDDFSCLADGCHHSCCRGWEIDIDPATADLYRSLQTPLGELIRRNINTTGEGTSFRLTEDERCPFLQTDGLCQLIREAGEDILCDICTNHPRFFVMAGDIELGGVGLSCEKSVELLLADTSPLTFCAEDDGHKFSFAEVFQLTGIDIKDSDLYFTPDTSLSFNLAVIDVLSRTEPIDEQWTASLADLRAQLPSSEGLLKKYAEEYPPQLFNRLYQYILYRQLCCADEAGPDKVVVYARSSAQYIFCVTAMRGDLPEQIRRWSEQIEYCPENVELLLNEAAPSSPCL
ncbi:MAG: flagellin lysine-N-methylase [Selenomonadaceae bacterium]|nr:flagellin lysine-N-methylase [Selenomonadaceae bacterium]